MKQHFINNINKVSVILVKLVSYMKKLYVKNQQFFLITIF